MIARESTTMTTRHDRPQRMKHYFGALEMKGVYSRICFPKKRDRESDVRDYFNSIIARSNCSSVDGYFICCFHHNEFLSKERMKKQGFSEKHFGEEIPSIEINNMRSIINDEYLYSLYSFSRSSNQEIGPLPITSIYIIGLPLIENISSECSIEAILSKVETIYLVLPRFDDAVNTLLKFTRDCNSSR
jgi:hypothetical protein